MEDIVIKLEDGRMLIKLNNAIYEKEAVMLATYKMTDSCFVIVKPLENNQLGVYFESKDNLDKNVLEATAKKFCNEVLDEQVRLDIEKRYGNIRDLLVKQALSPIENISDKIRV